MKFLKFIAISLLLVPAAMLADVPGRSIEELNLTTTNGRLSLAVIGDLHGKPSGELAVALHRHHAAEPFDAILILGDNFETGVSSVDDPLWDAIIDELSALEIPLLPILGNHDYGNPKRRFGRIRTDGNPDPGAQTAFRRGGWTFPSRNYVITSDVAEIIMIDSTPLAMNLKEPLLGSGTADQIAHQLEERLRRSADGRWRIVAGHHNISHSGMKRFRSRKILRNMQRLGRILEAAEADLYLSGHQHHAELFTPAHGSTTQLISGLGGPRPKRARKLHPARGGTQFIGTVTRKAAAFAVLDIDSESITIRFHDDRDVFPGVVHALNRSTEGEELLGGG